MRINSDQIPEGPPWTPQVWRDSPEVLVQEAQKELWVEYKDLQTVLSTGAGPAGGGEAMSGQATAPENESDQLISTQPMGGSTSVLGEWNKAMSDMKDTEPIDAWEGTSSGPLNPAP